MSDFKGRHFSRDIILWAVRWYCKYGISYRELAEMLLERGVTVNHTTLYRWVQRYAPEVERRLRWCWKPGWSSSWQVDETYVRVSGIWMYLYRAITKEGHTVDFYLSRTRNQKAAKCFLGKALRSIEPHQHPKTINTDKDRSYTPALASLKKNKVCADNIVQRQVKYLNNPIESDHGKLKRLINPVRGFQSMKTAFATIRGFEVMRMFRKGQFAHWLYGRGPLAEVRLVEEMFTV
ncbi:IS6 family transposase [Photobacterium sanctipauli]|uniref:IS6 family transposase n=1 Tax=Photobacterium sanctipauli TaxID=1342794 RepID=A0A2T3NP22_9GAMM|nr:IS6 family transposase [Photobacterium sanctipauli]PSW18023.1 IS6 family transposase [Photobacterium sanctipauli]